MRWGWEDAWAAFAMAVAALLVIFLGCFAASDKKIRSYYLEQHTGFCVMQSIDWDADGFVFCSPDIDKVLDVLVKANASLKK